MRLFCFLLVLVSSFTYSICFLGLGINITNSMPKGFYIKVEKEIALGDIVTFCLKDEDVINLAKERNYLKNGSCDNGLKPLLKRVMALEGDYIDISSLNIQEFDSKGRKMFSKLEDNVVPKGKALVLSENMYSFDSRYFGLVDVKELTPMKQIF